MSTGHLDTLRMVHFWGREGKLTLVAEVFNVYITSQP
jgi:hypothetical protein